MDEARARRPQASEQERPVARLLALARREPGLAAMVAMAVAGGAIAIYLTTVHYAGVPLYCSTTGLINCSAVTSSKYSVVPGTQLPITIPGLLWFLVSGGMAALALVRVWQARPEPERLRLAHFLWSVMGLLFVLYLVYAEIVQLRRICEWCTVIHIMTFVTFLVALNRVQQVPVAPAAAPARRDARAGSRARVATAPATPPAKGGSRGRSAAQPAGAKSARRRR